ncbi:MAG TPA: T9SS type A sorting domain-containing protein, partial [Bacteroidia bacterium]|nr:T9SS type A sorting domain-containing protein [Bacteroidia bacterium]
GTTMDLQGSFDTITCNTFLNNSGGPAIHWGDHSNPIASGLIFNNLFEGNSASDASVVLIGAGYYSGYNDTLIFANNIVRNNSCSASGSCCHFEPYLVNYYAGQYLRIYDNLFTGNAGGNLLLLHGDQNSNASFDFFYLKTNDFEDPGCTYELYNDVPYGSPNLYADNNYWSSSSVSHIDSVIYDYFDFANQSVVYYPPFLTTPLPIDSTCRPFVDMPEGVLHNIARSETEVKIYPNPFSDQAILQTSSPVHDASLTVTDCLGQNVMSIQHISETSMILSRGELPCGLYFFRLTEDQKTIGTGKFMIVER